MAKSKDGSFSKWSGLFSVIRRSALKSMLKVAAYALMWSYSIVHFAQIGVIFALQNYYGDFLASFPAYTIVKSIGRLDLFEGSLAEIVVPPPRWGYGPGMHIVTLPLLFLPTLREIYQVWLFINYGLLAAASSLLYRIAFAKPPTLMKVSVFAFVFLNYYPLYEGLIQRTIEIFELLLIVAAMTYYAKRRDRVVGCLVGFAAMTKFLPGIFLPYFALKRRWLAFLISLLMVSVVGILSQITLGWQNNDVLTQPVSAHFFYSQLNQSVAGFVLRVLRWLDETTLVQYGNLISLVAIITLGSAFAWIMFRYRRRGNWKIEWSLLLVAMIMLLPHNQNYYLMFLLVPYAVLIGMVLENYNPSLKDRKLKAVLTTPFVLTGWPFPLSIVNLALGLSLADLLLWIAVPVWGVALLVIVLIRVLRETALETRELAP